MRSEEEITLAIEKAERAERIKRGLPPDHLTDFAHFPFAFSEGRQELAAYAVTAGTPYPRVMAALARKDYETANACMDELQTAEPSAEKIRMRFGHSPKGMTIRLPLVLGDRVPPHALFLACDVNYLRRYAIPLLLSIAAQSPGAAVHIHLIGTDVTPIAPALKSTGLRISTSYETETLGLALRSPPSYFGILRLIRFCQAAIKSEGSLILADVDALVTGDIRGFIAAPTAAIRVRAGRVQPWQQYSACLIKSSRETRPYFRRTLDILLDELESAWWGMDQYALFSAAIGTKPAFNLIGPETASVVEDVPGLFWFTAGRNKLTLMNGDTPYAVCFRQYIPK